MTCQRCDIAQRRATRRPLPLPPRNPHRQRHQRLPKRPRHNWTLLHPGCFRKRPKRLRAQIRRAPDRRRQAPRRSSVQRRATTAHALRALLSPRRHLSRTVSRISALSSPAATMTLPAARREPSRRRWHPRSTAPPSLQLLRQRQARTARCRHRPGLSQPLPRPTSANLSPLRLPRVRPPRPSLPPSQLRQRRHSHSRTRRNRSASPSLPPPWLKRWRRQPQAPMRSPLG